MGISDFEFSDDDEEFLKVTRPVEVIEPGPEPEPEPMVQPVPNAVTRDNLDQGHSEVVGNHDRSNQVASSTSINEFAGQTNIDYHHLPSKVRDKLYQADGEIAILKHQLHQAKTSNYSELSQLKQDYASNKTTMEDQIKSLKATIQSLEDQQVFLQNEVRASSKKRKIAHQHTTTTTNIPNNVTNNSANHNSHYLPAINLGTISTDLQLTLQKDLTTQRIIKIQDETSLLIDHIWKLTINGSERTTMNYLSKICIDTPIIIDNFKFTSKSPLSGLILEYLILQKELRLDLLFENFLKLLINLIEKLIELNLLLSIPFLLSLIHGTLIFKPLATKNDIIKILIKKLVSIINKFAYNLNNEEIINLNISLTIQDQILQNFIIICCMDIIEILMSFTVFNNKPGTNNNDLRLGLELFENYGIKKLLEFFVPSNIEKDQNSLQINILYNLINIINYVLHETNNGGDKILNSKLCQLLFKLCLINIPIKNEFKFFGLNRIIGNNQDFKKFSKIVPEDIDKLNNSIIFKPNPIINYEENISNFRIKYHHEFHLMELQFVIIKLVDNYIVNSLNLDILKNKDTVKIIVKILTWQQNLIKISPRSKLINFRIRIISNLIRILNCLFKFENNLGLIIYNDTLVELVILLSKIAFGSENLINKSNELIKNLRFKKYKSGIFNKQIESLARDIHHVNNSDRIEDIIDAETEYPNGLEYPYNSETIELSREILGKVINTELADNLYININGSLNYDEMDMEMD